MNIDVEDNHTHIMENYINDPGFINLFATPTAEGYRAYAFRVE